MWHGRPDVLCGTGVPPVFPKREKAGLEFLEYARILRVFLAQSNQKKTVLNSETKSEFKRFFSYQPPMLYYHLIANFSDAHARPVTLTDTPTIAHIFPKRQCRKSSLTQSKDIPGGTSSQ
ncbi:MAG: hypothetical protein QQW96_21805 [Tychonema bourrellyi B0820]|uniref:hypothetical protein n=1 Tax=Tychonema bourrellyi TaxID=54313 RepID=UPI00117F378D|nr:hypothetical protein [Tychonema bourrellyi]MDQ2100271.1 hypothetical protein [Tychonema bourrellyi B0820]